MPHYLAAIAAQGESVMGMDYKTRLVILALVGLVALVLNTYPIA